MFVVAFSRTEEDFCYQPVCLYTCLWAHHTSHNESVWFLICMDVWLHSCLLIEVNIVSSGTRRKYDSSRSRRWLITSFYWLPSITEMKESLMGLPHRRVCYTVWVSVQRVMCVCVSVLQEHLSHIGPEEFVQAFVQKDPLDGTQVNLYFYFFYFFFWRIGGL